MYNEKITEGYLGNFTKWTQLRSKYKEVETFSWEIRSDVKVICLLATFSAIKSGWTLRLSKRTVTSVSFKGSLVVPRTMKPGQNTLVSAFLDATRPLEFCECVHYYLSYFPL